MHKNLSLQAWYALHIWFLFHPNPWIWNGSRNNYWPMFKGTPNKSAKNWYSCILTSWSLNDQWKFFLKPLCPFKLAPKFGFLVLLVSKTASPPNKFITFLTSPPKLKVSQMASPPNLLQDHLGLISFRCGGDVIWETFSFGGDAIWVTNLFGGDAVLETSSTRKPNF